MREPSFEYIQTRGARLRVVVEGNGPLCVLVHGWPESWYSWRHQISALLAAGYRVAVPDVRGYGGSECPQPIEAYDMISLTDDVIDLIDALGEAQAVLIGHDWGAPIVWTTALRYPERIRAVIGLSVPYLGRPDRPVIEIFREIYKDRFFYQIYFQTPGVAEKELEADIRTSLRKIYYCGSGEAGGKGISSNKSGPDSPVLEGLDDPDPFPAWLTEEDMDYYVAQFEKAGFRGGLNRYRTQERDHALLSILSERKITQPALFIAGNKDSVLRFMPGVYLHDLMDKHYDDLRGKILIEGAGHWIQQERPREVNEAIISFLKAL